MTGVSMSGGTYPSRESLNDLTAGQSTMNRDDIVASTAQVSQRVLLAYFTSRKTELVNQLVSVTGGTAAGATPTICRMGIYLIAANGDGTLVGATTNDTALFNTINARHAKAVTTPFTIIKGLRYAFCNIIVTAAALPTFQGSNSALGVVLNQAPRMAGIIGSQANLPSTFVSASVTDISQRLYGEILP